MRALLAGLMAVWAGAGSAETIVSPEAFQHLAEGRTLYFAREGVPFGIEQFFSNRRVTWQFQDGTCVDGAWFADGPAICFAYEGDPATHCWLFLKDGERQFARMLEDGVETDFEIDLVGRDQRDLVCVSGDQAV